MKKFLSLWVGLLAFLTCFSALAFQVPPAPADGFLLDQAGVLSSGGAQKIKNKLHKINAESRNEIAVLVVSSLEGENIDDVAHQVFNTWGVGKKGTDNGILLLVSINDRKLRIEVGKGVEGELTDLQSNDIINKNIKPHFKKKHYAKGIDEGVTAITSTLESRHGSADSSHSAWFWILVLFAILVVIFLIWAISRSGGGWGSGGSWSSGSSGGGGDFFGGGESGGGGSSDDW